jgi:hypothetical protein
MALLRQGDQIAILNPRLSLSICRESSHETSLSQLPQARESDVVARYLPWRRTVIAFSQKAGLRWPLLPVNPSLKLKLIVT